METYGDRITQGAIQCGIPGRMIGGLVRYFDEGVAPGGFLCAVLRNQLKQACSHADEENLMLLPNYVRLLYNFAPMHAWGSEENFNAWLKQFPRKD